MRTPGKKCVGQFLVSWAEASNRCLGFAIVFLSLALIPVVAKASDSSDGAGLTTQSALMQAGERMYREGVLPSGKVMRAMVSGGAPMQDSQTACMSCHRRSGMGANEGQTVVPPVTGAFLGQPRDAQASQLAYLSTKTARRPGYTDAMLARAIRDGIDSSGHSFAGPMPRYSLSDHELVPLIAYLKSLSSGAAPGVNNEEIHFATLVTEGVAAGKRKAMTDLLEAFIHDKNAETRYEGRRARQGPWTMRDYKAFRKWRLHVWKLNGPADTWRSQLEAHYRKQPVFAMLGGLASGAWQPIHDFCEGMALPCLFPNTDLPAVAETGFYSIYFSRGMSLEADVLASHLHETAAGSVIQVFGDEVEGVAAAEALNKALERRGAARSSDVRIGAGSELAFQKLLQEKSGVNLVLWQREPDLMSLERWAGKIDRVFLSATLADPLPQIPTGLRNKVYFVNPYALPSVQVQRQARVRAWLRAKNIPLGETRIQSNTYFAATVAADALMRVAFNFSREYFIERIEDMVDNAVTTGVYPHASLGPTQRFISKGAYIVKVDAENGFAMKSKWIVP